MWPYLIKVIIAITVFFSIYRLLYRNDTFFSLRRMILLSMIVISVLYPLTDVSDYIRQNKTLSEAATAYVNWIPNIEMANPPEEELPTPINWGKVLSLSYLTICAILLFNFSIQFLRLIWLRMTSTPHIYNGIKIYQLESNDAPFSFFHWIFLNPSNHSEKEINEIITHELAHVEQHHTLDVIMSELFTILCWINPMVWILRSEIRTNLEFLADNHVVDRGHDPKSYQYHLLKLAHQPIKNNLTNRLAVSPLKKRIIMMNRNQSPKIKLVTYTLLLPVTLLFIGANSAPSIAEVPTVVNEMLGNIKTIQIDEIVVMAYSQHPFDPSKHKKLPEPIDRPQNPSPDVNLVAQYPGGNYEMMMYLVRTVKYPTQMADKNETGRVYCSFTVKPDGSVVDKKIVSSTADLFSTEVMRVINNMPNWTASKSNQKGESIEYIVPFTFRLDFKESGNNSPTSQLIKGKEIASEESSNKEITVVGYGAIDKNEQIRKTHTTDLSRNESKDATQTNNTLSVRNVNHSQNSINHVDNSSNTSNSAISHLGVSFHRANSSDKSEPLYIIDGKEGDEATLRRLNPSRIERMEVLKDKSAVDLYGNKGNNGVILITTKRQTSDDQESMNSEKDKSEYVFRGNNGGQLTINGESSNGEANPLFIVEGKEFSESEFRSKVSPNDIEKMEVLKRESALKIYGEKGKHGAILVTLKKRTSQLTDREKSPAPLAKPVPYFPGGEEALLSYIDKNVQYPAIQSKKPIQGKVWVFCMILPDGSVSNIRIEKGIDPAFDNEAIRVINSLPKWEVPNSKIPVRSIAYVIPVNFRVQKDS